MTRLLALIALMVISSVSAQTVAPPPATWIKCADEGNTCSRSPTSRREVRYGSGTVWISRVVDLGTIPCIDPAWSATAVAGTAKSCWYDPADTTSALSPPVPQPSAPPTWVYCATSGEVCRFAGRRDVYYGPGAVQPAPTLANAKVSQDGFKCDIAIWGSDPAPGVWKTCWFNSAGVTTAQTTVASSLPVPIWLHCANENGACNTGGRREVRYGAGTIWKFRVGDGNVPCTNGAWGGDPVVGVAKTCQFNNAEWTTSPVTVGGTAPPPSPLACVGKDVTWPAGAVSPICSATYPGGASGTSVALADNAHPDNGTATASCLNGVVTLTAPVCTATPPLPTPAPTPMGWACAPKQIGGAGTSLQFVQSTAGKAYWWLCDRDQLKSSAFLIQLNNYVPSSLTCGKPLSEMLVAMQAAADPLAAANALFAKCYQVPAAVDVDNYNALGVMAANAAKAEYDRLIAIPPPPPPQWSVPADSAPVGAACDCASPLTFGGKTYCPVVETPAMWSVCTAK